jgi:VanZ family protein
MKLDIESWASDSGSLPETSIMQKPFRSFLLNLSITLAYCFLIYVQSAYPSPDRLPNIPHIDKLLHFGAYAVLGILFFRTFESLPIDNSLKVVMILGILSSTLYGISDEIHQHYVPYRSADIWDGVANLLGSIFGVFAYRYLLKRHRGPLRDGDR